MYSQICSKLVEYLSSVLQLLPITKSLTDGHLILVNPDNLIDDLRDAQNLEASITLTVGLRQGRPDHQIRIS